MITSEGSTKQSQAARIGQANAVIQGRGSSVGGKYQSFQIRTESLSTSEQNALQSDPVATGPSDSRFITRTYIGDLDGNLWRFDIALDASNNPKITGTTKLYSSGTDQPIFNSMATLNVGGTQQYIFFGTGGDLLPGTDKATTYHLLGVQDNGATGAKTLDQVLQKSNSASITVDERVTAFPAVGDCRLVG